MPLFELNKNRYLSTEHIADIEYTPESSLAIVINFVPGDTPPLKAPPVINPSRLRIDLKGNDGEHILLEAAEANAAWAAFQAAMGRSPHAQTEDSPGETDTDLLLDELAHPRTQDPEDDHI